MSDTGYTNRLERRHGHAVDSPRSPHFDNNDHLQPLSPRYNQVGSLSRSHGSSRFKLAQQGRQKRWWRHLALLGFLLLLVIVCGCITISHLHRSDRRHEPIHDFTSDPNLSRQQPSTQTTQRQLRSSVQRVPWAAVAARRRAAQALTSRPRTRAPWGAAGHHEYIRKARAGPYPIKLKYPVVWSGALFSKSGYGTEAVSYVAGLLQSGLVAPEDLWISQSGDYVHKDVLETMDPGLLELLHNHHYKNMTEKLSPEDVSRPLIVVCHSFPDCWRTPIDDDTRMTSGKFLKGVSDFFKYKVLRKQWRDHGCPCPHQDIKDQVVYRVGRTMFETEHLPEPLAAYTKYIDEVWVPSNFNRGSFAASGVDANKLYTLSQGINTTLFNPRTQQPMDLASLGGVLVAGQSLDEDEGPRGGVLKDLKVNSLPPNVIDSIFNVAEADLEARLGADNEDDLLNNRVYRFLSVFKWEARKGWDILLPAYVKEFRGERNVELHIVTKEAFEKVKDFPTYFRRVVGPLVNATKEEDWAALPRVYLHHKHIPDNDYPKVYAAMDALVIPTHGEGWGRPQIEAMAMSLPVISTNWSGLTAFMDDQVSYPIRVADVVPVKDEGPNSFEWFAGQRWAQPDEAHLRELMRHVFTKRGAAYRKGKAARAKVLRDFSELAVAQQLLAHLLRLQDEVDDLLWGGSAGGATAATVLPLTEDVAQDGQVQGEQMHRVLRIQHSSGKHQGNGIAHPNDLHVLDGDHDVLGSQAKQGPWSILTSSLLSIRRGLQRRERRSSE